MRSYLELTQPGVETFGEIPSSLIVVLGVHCEKSGKENNFIESSADNKIPFLIFIATNLQRSYTAYIEYQMTSLIHCSRKGDFAYPFTLVQT